MTAEINIPQADICVCAADIFGFLALGLEFPKRRIAPALPFVVVHGNHDYCGNSIEDTLSAARASTNKRNINVLESETLEIDHVRIIGAALWIDFKVPWGLDDELPTFLPSTMATTT